MPLPVAEKRLWAPPFQALRLSLWAAVSPNCHSGAGRSEAEKSLYLTYRGLQIIVTLFAVAALSSAPKDAEQVVTIICNPL